MIERHHTLLNVEAYAALPDDGVPTELVRGRVVREPQPAYAHARVQLWLGQLLTRAIADAGWPLECAGPVGCIVEEHPDTVRGPDLVVVRRGRTPGRADFVAGGPELAVEILSPSNRRGELRRRIEEYHAAGTRVVWVLDTRRRRVEVHRPGVAQLSLEGEDRLDSGGLMPGLALTASAVFSVLR